MFLGKRHKRFSGFGFLSWLVTFLLGWFITVLGWLFATGVGFGSFSHKSGCWRDWSGFLFVGWLVGTLRLFFWWHFWSLHERSSIFKSVHHQLVLNLLIWSHAPSVIILIENGGMLFIFNRDGIAFSALDSKNVQFIFRITTLWLFLSPLEKLRFRNLIFLSGSSSKSWCCWYSWRASASKRFFLSSFTVTKEARFPSIIGLLLLLDHPAFVELLLLSFLNFLINLDRNLGKVDCQIVKVVLFICLNDRIPLGFMWTTLIWITLTRIWITLTRVNALSYLPTL